MSESVDFTNIVVVNKGWYERAIEILGDRCGCPFCGSSKGFDPKRGCSSCNTWWTPPGGPYR